MLSDAGFTAIKVDTDEKGGLVEDLPPYEIRSYKAESGAVYWYYDPDICLCVYEGHQGDYDRYQVAQRQESDTAQYAAQSDDQQVASLNALNGGFFPPPIFWIGGIAPEPHFGGGGHGGGHFGGGQAASAADTGVMVAAEVVTTSWPHNCSAEIGLGDLLRASN